MINKIHSLVEDGTLSKSLAASILEFYRSYSSAIEKQGRDIKEFDHLFDTLTKMLLKQMQAPYHFELFHKRLKEPFDYYQFGLDFLRPLVVEKDCRVLGLQFVDRMIQQISSGENVILLANHQTEPDPQAISLLLDKSHPGFAQDIIFVAGHRVTSDPLAVPLSLGRNLLCIYSKRHIDHPPEEKQNKLLHNKRTMLKMGELLAEGGKCIYVAPSGGRDRPNASGHVEVAPFDPKSIEMFRFIAEKAEKPSHFYPLTLATYSLLPPPDTLNKELGEERYTCCTPIHLAFDAEVDLQHFPGSENLDRRSLREKRAEHIWQIVNRNYEKLLAS